MKTVMARMLPIVIGIGLGMLIMYPPAWLRGLGWVAYLVTGSTAAVVLVAFVALLISANLPSDIAITPVPERPVPPELTALGEHYRALGFTQVGPLMEVGISPPGVILPFVHERERTYGTAFRTSTVPPRVSFDFFSYLESDRGGLTSSPEPGGATIPAGRGDLRQVIRGADVETLFAAHRDALTWLRGQDLPPRAVSAGAFVADFKAAIARHRANFLTSPLTHAAVAIWRAASKRTPHLGALAHQRVGARQVRALTATPRS
jgi:hypothetical protein